VRNWEQLEEVVSRFKNKDQERIGCARHETTSKGREEKPSKKFAEIESNRMTWEKI
jgi:hypothetical protein